MSEVGRGHVNKETSDPDARGTLGSAVLTAGLTNTIIYTLYIRIMEAVQQPSTSLESDPCKSSDFSDNFKQHCPLADCH